MSQRDPGELYLGVGRLPDAEEAFRKAEKAFTHNGATSRTAAMRRRADAISN